MSNRPSSGRPGEADQDVVKEDNLVSNPATAVPTASAEPKIVRQPESRTRFSVRVVLQRLANVAINVNTNEPFHRPLAFFVVGLVALVATGLTAWLRPDVQNVPLTVALYVLALLAGGLVLWVGLRFVDKKIHERHDGSA